TRAKWYTTIKTPAAGGPYTITISERNTIVLHYVMIGEVWLLSGQSNMEWTTGAGIDNKDREIAESNIPSIHHIKIPRTSSDFPQDDITASWEVCSPESMPRFSAVGYFFAKELTEKLHVPVGLIHASWGGSAIEAWTPKNIIDADPEYSKWRDLFPETYLYPYLPGTTYNAMIHPLTPYKIAGVLWYQGESNVSNAPVYRRLFPDMIQSWRKDWGYEFPFYFVQLAPYKYGRPLQGALLQEAQRLTLSVPNTGMAVTTDIGNVQDIHPKNKIDVGKRLAYWALAKNYNVDVPYSGPLFKSMIKENNKIKVTFDHINGGLEIKGNKPELYKIAGENKQFIDAKVEVEEDGLVFSSDVVTDPVAVRYAFTNISEGNLFNKAGLPASPFRTDDWPVVYNNVAIKSVYDPTKQGFLITLEGDPSDKFVYSIDGSEPGLSSSLYEGPFLIKQKTNVSAKAVTNNVLSQSIATKEIILSKATYRPVTYITPASSKYAGSGIYTLINGQRGNITNANDPEWQGWDSDMEVILDLGENQKTHKISVGFLQNQNAWIFLPSQVTISVSTNGKTFVDVDKENEVLANNRTPLLKTYEANLNTTARYIKVKAMNIGTCPAWHPGSGSKSWVFADEIVVE
ncbi:MAG: sialate O-acetylesterase, partial [Saprospiraceae bacterium]